MGVLFVSLILSLYCHGGMSYISQSLVIFKYNVAWNYMSEENFLCLTLEDDDLAGLSMLDGWMGGRLDNKL